MHSSICVCVCNLCDTLCCLWAFFIVCLRIMCWSLRRRPACRNQWFGCRMQVCSTAAACCAVQGFLAACITIKQTHFTLCHAPQLSGVDVRVLCHLELRFRLRQSLVRHSWFSHSSRLAGHHNRSYKHDVSLSSALCQHNFIAQKLLFYCSGVFIFVLVSTLSLLFLVKFFEKQK